MRIESNFGPGVDILTNVTKEEEVALRLKAVSAGDSAGTRAEFYVNGNIVVANEGSEYNGHNVAELDEAGNVLRQETFRTHESWDESYDLANFINVKLGMMPSFLISSSYFTIIH